MKGYIIIANFKIPIPNNELCGVLAGMIYVPDVDIAFKDKLYHGAKFYSYLGISPSAVMPIDYNMEDPRQFVINFGNKVKQVEIEPSELEAIVDLCSTIECPVVEIPQKLSTAIMEFCDAKRKI